MTRLTRRRGLLSLLLAAPAVTALTGCAAPRPVPRLYQLRLDAPADRSDAAPAPPAGPTATDAAQVWQLVLPVRLPEYLDREAIVVQSGDTSLDALPAARWAEPLRDALPRVLQHDLSLWLGGAVQVWAGLPPAGTPVTRQLRLEIQGFEALASRAAVRLRARWSATDPRAAPGGTSVAEADITVPSDGGDVASWNVAALVQAHRVALWRLAQRMAQQTPHQPPQPPPSSP